MNCQRPQRCLRTELLEPELNEEKKTLFNIYLSTLIILFHCLLVSMVSDEKSAVNLIEDLLYITNLLLQLSRFFAFWIV